MRVSYCKTARLFFCSACATATEEIGGSFWGWSYYFSYRSPWSGQWAPSLDRMEFQGIHPFQIAETRRLAQAAVSKEHYLVRFPERIGRRRPQHEITDRVVQANWNANAEKWNARYDDDGDRNRRYQSDASMLALLGEVASLRVLDVGSGNGYLCRKLARAGARMTGVELSDRFLEIAVEGEREEKLGIAYYHASASEMDFLPDSHFDKAVSNYVLMDVRDYTAALSHVCRVLKPGGCFVVVISHPCFSIGPAGWVAPAPDSPRPEERKALLADAYFRPGPYLSYWENFDPIVSFHRPLRDYWLAFIEAGFIVDAFEEPSIADRGRRELPFWKVEQSLKAPYSCIFRLVKR